MDHFDFVPDLNIHSFHKKARHLLCAERPARGVCAGAWGSVAAKPVPVCTLYPSRHTCCELLPSRGPSRQRPSLTQAALH